MSGRKGWLMTAPPRRSAWICTSSFWSRVRTTDSTPLSPGVRTLSSTLTGQPQRADSQPATSWAVGLAGSPWMRPPLIATGSPRRPATESTPDARMARHPVLRVQARSVSPGA